MEINIYTNAPMIKEYFHHNYSKLLEKLCRELGLKLFKWYCRNESQQTS